MRMENHCKHAAGESIHLCGQPSYAFRPLPPKLALTWGTDGPGKKKFAREWWSPAAARSPMQEGTCGSGRMAGGGLERSEVRHKRKDGEGALTVEVLQALGPRPSRAMRRRRTPRRHVFGCKGRVNTRLSRQQRPPYTRWTRPTFLCVALNQPLSTAYFPVAIMIKGYSQTLPLLTIGFLSPSWAATGRARQSKTRSSDEADMVLVSSRVGGGMEVCDQSIVICCWQKGSQVQRRASCLVCRDRG